MGNWKIEKKSIFLKSTKHVLKFQKSPQKQSQTLGKFFFKSLKLYQIKAFLLKLPKTIKIDETLTTTKNMNRFQRPATFFSLSQDPRIC